MGTLDIDLIIGTLLYDLVTRQHVHGQAVFAAVQIAGLQQAAAHRCTMGLAVHQQLQLVAQGKSR